MTVFSLIPSSRAICLLALPLASALRTSRSRGVSSAAGRCSVRAVSTAEAALGANGASPAAAARTPRMSSSGSASLSR